jgi:RNA polymerase sigma-70 factor (ECF subfamily)
MANSFDVFRRGERIEWPGSTNHSWVVRLQDRDEAAWEQLLELYAPAVFRWCRRLGVEGEDLVDVSQDILVKACRAIDTFLVHEDCSFRGWLWTLTKHQVLDYLRRSKRSMENTLSAGNALSLEHAAWHDPPRDSDDHEERTDVPNEILQQQWSLVLESLRSRFRPHTWDAFWRTVVEEELPEDVAKDLGISINSVYLARSRILRLLREELAGLRISPPYSGGASQRHSDRP